jgi:hypothetical protein
MPAKAGIHIDLRPVTQRLQKAKWIPAYAGMTARKET